MAFCGVDLCGVKLIMVLLVVTSFMSFIPKGDAADDKLLGASFIFGDSLVDAGNNNYLNTLSKADSTPNGIDFEASGGTPTGRFTNGRTIGDIEKNWEFQIMQHPFWHQMPQEKNILYGVNYASGGGGILNATGRIFAWNGRSNRLLQHHKKTNDKLMGASKARDYIQKKSIMSITVGSNDFLNNYLLPVISVGARITQNPDTFTDEMITHLPDQLARKYNAKLKDLLTQLSENLPGSTFVYANVYDLVMELITNYKKYGQYAGIIPCGPTSSFVSRPRQACVLGPVPPEPGGKRIVSQATT
ncbi:hypothetical protein RDABS01_004839 [Bienertia sinuspersici]